MTPYTTFDNNSIIMLITVNVSQWPVAHVVSKAQIIDINKSGFDVGLVLGIGCLQIRKQRRHTLFPRLLPIRLGEIIRRVQIG